MTRSSSIALFSLFFALAAATLTGCAGVSASFPESGAPAASVESGAISGSVFGGHAPITGSHVYVFQPGTSGYGGAATSLLGNNSATHTTSNPPYQITANASQTTPDPDMPAGAAYVATDSNGAFNVSGGYTCISGLPVFLYAYGGSVSVEPVSTLVSFSISSSVVTFNTSSGANNQISAGQTVNIANVAPTSYSYLDGVYTVTSAPTATSFTAAAPSGHNYQTQVTLTGGSATPVAASNNKAIVELAVLGNCGALDSINYVYMNEVSTTAAAYALSGFFSESSTALVSTYATHISIPGTASLSDAAALAAIQNAAANASQLYNIQGGGSLGSGTFGSALATTPSGGTAPQSAVDAIANALSACVDSGSSSSSACTVLFGDFESTGTTGTAPTDTATAAINMAHNPWNTNASAIVALGKADVPPYYSTASSLTDLALGIEFTPTATSQSAPYVAIDGSGNAWYLANSSSEVIKVSPLGVVGTPTTGITTPFQAAVDTNDNIWITEDSNATGTGLVELSNAGVLATNSPFLGSTLSYDEGIAIDGSNNIYVSNNAGQESTGTSPSPTGTIVEVNAGAPTTVVNTYSENGTCTDTVAGLALDSSSSLWVANSVATGEHSHVGTIGACKYPSTSTTTPTFKDTTNLTTPIAVAIDSSGNGWFVDEGATAPKGLDEITSTGTLTQKSGGGVDKPTTVAVDGSGLIFTSNGGNSVIAVYGSLLATPAFLTGTSGLTGGYTPSGSLAIDASGDVWATDDGSGNLYEYIGMATPVLTPLSAQLALATPKTATKP